MNIDCGLGLVRLGRLGVEPLVNVLQLALGDPTEFCDDEGISWSHGQFPPSETLQRWKAKFRRAEARRELDKLDEARPTIQDIFRERPGPNWQSTKQMTTFGNHRVLY